MKLKQNIFLLIFTILLLLGLTGCGKKTVVLDDYLEFSSEGYDTKGTATVSFDYRKFEDEYGKKIKFKKKDERRKFIKEYSLKSSISDAKLLISTCVKLELDEDSNLSNGDTVNVKFDCDEELAEEYFGVEFSYSDVEYTVENLKKVDKFNPFDYIKVTFTGTSPNGSVSIETDKAKKREELQYFTFNPNKIEGIKIGDTIKVIAECDINDDEFIEKFGSIIEKTENEYKCDNIDRYVTKADEISEKAMNELIAEGNSILNEDAASGLSETEKLINVAYVGNYFLSAKAGISNWSENYLYLVYKIQVSNSKYAQLDYYDYVRYEDIKLLADGNFSLDLSNYQTARTRLEHFYPEEGGYFYYGYQDLSSFTNDCITSKADNYEYTTSITQ
jgi:hypothetical protein